MAEFEELDGVLRDALQRAAQPGDSTGVADAIRSRVAAGDPGTSVAGGTAPGWGGGVWSWMPWVGLIAVGALVGGAVGVSGAVGRPAGDVTVDVPVSIGESAPAHSCVDGPIIGRIAANTRVLAVQRSDDALWVGVRDPGALGGTIWVTLGDVSLDEGTPALDELPVGGACPETVVIVPTEEPVVRMCALISRWAGLRRSTSSPTSCRTTSASQEFARRGAARAVVDQWR
jgi:hypothetical protein